MSEQKMNAGGRWLSALLLCFAVLNAGAAVAQAGKADKITPTIVAPPAPGSQAKFGNIVTVIAGNGRAVTSGNGARQTTLYTQDLAGKSIEAVMAHETEHLFGVAKIPADKYYSNGQPIPGWEGNIMSDPNGSVDERNIEDMLSFGCPYLGKESQGGESSTSQSSSDGQGCMRKGGDCWH